MAKGGTKVCNSNNGIKFPQHLGGSTTLTAVGAHTGDIKNPCALMNLSADSQAAALAAAKASGLHFAAPPTPAIDFVAPVSTIPKLSNSIQVGPTKSTHSGSTTTTKTVTRPDYADYTPHQIAVFKR